MGCAMTWEKFLLGCTILTVTPFVVAIAGMLAIGAAGVIARGTKRLVPS